MFLYPLSAPVPALTPAEENLLRSRSITPEAPGTILRDFETLLDFVGEEGVPVSAKQHVLGGSTLTDLNARLSRPLIVSFKRPRQRSFPYVHALYLLLRASGLAFVERQGSQNRLRLDPAVVSSWDGLDPVAQYFSLFQAWMMRLDEDALLGDRVDPTGPLYRCYRFLAQLPPEGHTLSAPAEQEDLRYYPGFHHIALLDLFGLIDVEEATTAEDDGWRLHRFVPRPFGVALMKYTAALYQAAHTADDIWEVEANWRPAALQAWLQRYFPAWEHTLAAPLAGFREGAFIFKVSLGPKVWRRLLLPAHATLEALADLILDAFAFEDRYHLDRFSFQGPYGLPVEINHPAFDEGPWTDEVRVGDVPLREGQPMTYIFDFGDWWRFEVLLERIAPQQDAGPSLLETHGEAPEQYPDYDDDDDDDDSLLFLDPNDE